MRERKATSGVSNTKILRRSATGHDQRKEREEGSMLSSQKKKKGGSVEQDKKLGGVKKGRRFFSVPGILGPVGKIWRKKGGIDSSDEKRGRKNGITQET